MVTISQITPIPFTDLEDASTLTGDEVLAIVQATQSVQTTISALPAGLEACVVVYGNTGGAPFPNFRTLKAGTNVNFVDGGEQGDLTVSFSGTGTGTVTSVSGTSSRITSTGGVDPVIDISASYVGQGSIVTTGTVTSGTWASQVAGATINNSIIGATTRAAGSFAALNANGAVNIDNTATTDADITIAANNALDIYSGVSGDIQIYTTIGNVTIAAAGANKDMALSTTRDMTFEATSRFMSFGSGDDTNFSVGGDFDVTTTNGRISLDANGSGKDVNINADDDVIIIAADVASVSGSTLSLSATSGLSLNGAAVYVGSVALATNATSGFLWIPSCAGIPTGQPTAPYTNAAPIILDTSNKRLYLRSGTTWSYAALT